MGLQRTYDTQDAIPEPLREHYVERDGRWHLDVDGGDSVPHDSADLTKVRRALDAERKVRGAEERRRKELEGELEELRAAKASPGDDGHAGAQLAAAEKRIKALEDLARIAQEKSEAAERRLADSRINDTLRREALALGVPAEMVEDFVSLPKVRSAFRLGDTGEPEIIDGTEIRYSEKDGKPMGPREFLGEILREKKYFLPPSGGAGVAGGSKGTSSGRVTISFADAQHHGKWNAAMEAARKAGQDAPVIVEAT